MKNRDIKPAADLIGELISKPDKLIEADHFMKCNNCGILFDMRNLRDVMKHETCINNN